MEKLVAIAETVGFICCALVIAGLTYLSGYFLLAYLTITR